MTFAAVLSVSLILFSVIDIIGSLPVLIDLKRQGMRIHAGRATFAAGGLMVAFLFGGVGALALFGIDSSSFALAGSLVIFFIGLEMTLGQRFFRQEPDVDGGTGSVVPIAFPLIVGGGTLTTIVSLKADYGSGVILAAILFNLLLVFGVLASLTRIAGYLSQGTLVTLRKVFGILLIAIAFQMFRANIVA